MRVISLLIVTLFLTQSSQAVTFEVKDSKGNYILKVEKDADLRQSVGDLTIAVLKPAQDAGKLQFQGDEDGIVSINGVGNDTQVVSNTEVKAYGWCFSLNGAVPSTMSNETTLKSNQDTVTWYYGYVRYLNGTWGTLCVPAWL